MQILKNLSKLIIISLFLVLLSAQSAGAAAEIVRCDCVGDIKVGLGGKDIGKICSLFSAPIGGVGCLNAKIPIISKNDKTECNKVTDFQLFGAVKKKVEEKKYTDHKLILVIKKSCSDATGHTSPSTVKPGGTTGKTAPATTKTLCKTEGGVEVCKLENPLKGDLSVNRLIGNVIRAMLGIVGALSLFAFVEGGIMWWQSFGNPEKINKGIQTMLWATLGLVVVFVSYAISKWILNLLLTGKV